MKRSALAVLPNISAPRPAPAGLLVEPGAQMYIMGACRIIVGRSTAGWHLSISCASRYPTWDELAKARYKLIPDAVTMAMLLPPQAEYVNLHPMTLHLWELEGKQPVRNGKQP
jgi:hypothetical protein